MEQTGQRVWTPPPSMTKAVASGWRGFFSHTWTEYGVDGLAYRDLYIAQHGCCYICRKAVGKNPDDPKGKGSRRLGVDHNHVTGAARGLLCTGSTSANTCNRLIGRYNLAQLKRAVQYLEGEPAQAVLQAGKEMDSLVLMAEDRDAIMSSLLGLR